MARRMVLAPAREMRDRQAMRDIANDPAKYAPLAKRIGEMLPNFAMRTFFDVGANVGQTSVSIRHLYPDAGIYAFEPVAETFARLSAAFAGDMIFRPFNFAVGAADGEATMLAQGTRVVNRIVGADEADADAVVVPVKSGDSFCAAEGVDEISYLKIDTEGHDLEVLKGFDGMLKRQAIDMVEVESGMHPGNKRHVPMERFKAHLEALNYFLFAIRELTHEYVGRPNLRRGNLVFASAKLLDANPKKRKRDL